jgi:hypothetical protein
MKIRKRYIVLILLALLPFYKIIHNKNYCFSDVDLVIIGGLTVLYIIAFLAVFFYNLYKITLKKELFNFRPLVITLVFLTTLYYALEYHDQNLFKEKVQIFHGTSKEDSLLEINLFNDDSFELKTINEDYPKSFCVEKGTYYYKKDTLFLNKFNNVDGNIVFGDVYIYNKTYTSLNPIYTGLPIFVLKK